MNNMPKSALSGELETAPGELQKKEVAQTLCLLRHQRSKNDPGWGKPYSSFTSSHLLFYWSKLQRRQLDVCSKLHSFEISRDRPRRCISSAKPGVKLHEVHAGCPRLANFETWERSLRSWRSDFLRHRPKSCNK
jgi:hypothetical protein